MLSHDDADCVLVRVTAIGTKNSGRRRLEYEIVDRADTTNGITAMMRCTAYPASIVLQMLASKRIETHGVVVQERAIPAEEFITELAKRNIQVQERMS